MDGVRRKRVSRPSAVGGLVGEKISVCILVGYLVIPLGERSCGQEGQGCDYCGFSHWLLCLFEKERCEVVQVDPPVGPGVAS